MCPLVQLLPRVIHWINLPSKWSHSVRRLRVKDRLRFHASGRATFCSATSSALWSPTQVAFHGRSFAGPLPSVAPVTDGNEGVWVFLWVNSLLQNKPNMPWSRVRVCVCVFLLFLPSYSGKNQVLKGFLLSTSPLFEGQLTELTLCGITCLRKQSAGTLSVKESLQSHEWGMKMNKSTIWSRGALL